MAHCFSKRRAPALGDQDDRFDLEGVPLLALLDGLTEGAADGIVAEEWAALVSDDGEEEGSAGPMPATVVGHGARV